MVIGWSISVLPVIGALAGIPAGAAPLAHSPAEVTQVVVRTASVTSEARQRVLRYWSARRMLAAIAPRREAVGAGEPLRLRGPNRSSDGATWTDRGVVSRTTGKVFFTMGGRDYLCSASTVSSASRDLVVTAGHCARDASWADNWIFVPGYRDGLAPLGRFTARHLYVTKQWAARTDDDYDVAMVALNKRRGRHVADAAGTQRIAFGAARGRRVHVFGYPSSGHYDGTRLIYCSGKPKRDARKLTRDQGLRCDMTQGSSGGPWLARFDRSRGAGTIVSVSSFKYSDDPGTMYGPYFGDAIKRLYERAQHG